jgi:hypothetical protein
MMQDIFESLIMKSVDEEISRVDGTSEDQSVCRRIILMLSPHLRVSFQSSFRILLLCISHLLVALIRVAILGEVYELHMPGSFERGNEPSGFMLGFRCVAEQLLASEERLTSVELSIKCRLRYNQICFTLSMQCGISVQL